MFGLCWCLQKCLKGLQIKACPVFLAQQIHGVVARALRLVMQSLNGSMRSIKNNA